MQTSLLDYYNYEHINIMTNYINNLKVPKHSKNEISLKEEEISDIERNYNDYIKETIKKLRENNLYEKYSISIYIVINKERIKNNENLLKDIKISFVNALYEEKKNLEKTFLVLNNNLNSIILININIFIGLLINIINLFETFGIKSFSQNSVNKLNDIFIFLKNYLIPNFISLNPLYKNISLDFLLKKIEKLLSKLKIKEECYQLSRNILNYLGNEKAKFLSKKKKRENQNNLDEIIDINKKVKFDLDKNIIYEYDKDEIISKKV